MLEMESRQVRQPGPIKCIKNNANKTWLVNLLRIGKLFRTFNKKKYHVSSISQFLYFFNCLKPAPALNDVYDSTPHRLIQDRTGLLTIVVDEFVGCVLHLHTMHYCNDIFILPKNTHKYNQVDVYLHKALRVYFPFGMLWIFSCRVGT